MCVCVRVIFGADIYRYAECTREMACGHAVFSFSSLRGIPLRNDVCTGRCSEMFVTRATLISAVVEILGLL